MEVHAEPEEDHDFVVHTNTDALELEVVNNVVAREELVERTVQACSINDTIVGSLVRSLRLCTLKLALQLDTLRCITESDFQWLGQAYVFKMLHDQDFLDGFSEVRDKFDFSLVRNPLMLEAGLDEQKVRSEQECADCECSVDDLGKAISFFAAAHRRRSHDLILNSPIRESAPRSVKPEPSRTDTYLPPTASTRSRQHTPQKTTKLNQRSQRRRSDQGLMAPALFTTQPVNTKTSRRKGPPSVGGSPSSHHRSRNSRAKKQNDAASTHKKKNLKLHVVNFDLKQAKRAAVLEERRRASQLNDIQQQLQQLDVIREFHGHRKDFQDKYRLTEELHTKAVNKHKRARERLVQIEQKDIERQTAHLTKLLARERATLRELEMQRSKANDRRLAMEERLHQLSRGVLPKPETSVATADARPKPNSSSQTVFFNQDQNAAELNQRRSQLENRDQLRRGSYLCSFIIEQDNDFFVTASAYDSTWVAPAEANKSQESHPILTIVYEVSPNGEYSALQFREDDLTKIFSPQTGAGSSEQQQSPQVAHYDEIRGNRCQVATILITERIKVCQTFNIDDKGPSFVAFVPKPTRMQRIEIDVEHLAANLNTEPTTQRKLLQAESLEQQQLEKKRTQREQLRRTKKKPSEFDKRVEERRRMRKTREAESKARAARMSTVGTSKHGSTRKPDKKATRHKKSSQTRTSRATTSSSQSTPKSTPRPRGDGSSSHSSRETASVAEDNAKRPEEAKNSKGETEAVSTSQSANDNVSEQSDAATAKDSDDQRPSDGPATNESPQSGEVTGVAVAVSPSDNTSQSLDAPNVLKEDTDNGNDVASGQTNIERGKDNDSPSRTGGEVDVSDKQGSSAPTVHATDSSDSNHNETQSGRNTPTETEHAVSATASVSDSATENTAAVVNDQHSAPHDKSTVQPSQLSTDAEQLNDPEEQKTASSHNGDSEHGVPEGDVMAQEHVGNGDGELDSVSAEQDKTTATSVPPASVSQHRASNLNSSGNDTAKHAEVDVSDGGIGVPPNTDHHAQAPAPGEQLDTVNHTPAQREQNTDAAAAQDENVTGEHDALGRTTQEVENPAHSQALAYEDPQGHGDGMAENNQDDTTAPSFAASALEDHLDHDGSQHEQQVDVSQSETTEANDVSNAAPEASASEDYHAQNPNYVPEAYDSSHAAHEQAVHHDPDLQYQYEAGYEHTAQSDAAQWDQLHTEYHTPEQYSASNYNQENQDWNSQTTGDGAHWAQEGHEYQASSDTWYAQHGTESASTHPLATQTEHGNSNWESSSEHRAYNHASEFAAAPHAHTEQGDQNSGGPNGDHGSESNTIQASQAATHSEQSWHTDGS